MSSAMRCGTLCARGRNRVARSGNDGVCRADAAGGEQPNRSATKLSSSAKPRASRFSASFMGQERTKAMAILDRAGIPTFAYPDSAARAFCYLWQYTHALRALYETPALGVGAEDVRCARRSSPHYQMRAEIGSSVFQVKAGIERDSLRLRNSRRSYTHRHERTRSGGQSRAVYWAGCAENLFAHDHTQNGCGWR